MVVLLCKKFNARKDYVYYDGVIHKGEAYFRGFAIAPNNIPFEFMFTDASFCEEARIPTEVLEKECVIYYTKRKKNRSDL